MMMAMEMEMYYKIIINNRYRNRIIIGNQSMVDKVYVRPIQIQPETIYSIRV